MNKEKNLSYLVLIRHGQSEWNEKNLFTGWKNPPLTEKGIKEAELAGEKIKNLNIDFSHYFTSALVRAQETGEIILSKLEAENIIKTKSQNLNERDYGDLSGLSNDVKSKFMEIRPKTLGQALRIDGITPAAVYILLSHVKRKSIKHIA